MKFDRDYKLDSKTVEIYKDLKFEQVFRSLDMAIQLQMLIRLDSSLKKLKEMGHDEKYSLVTPEFIYNNLNKRGTNRTRRVLEFCDAIEQEYAKFTFDDPDSRKKMLKMFNR